MQIAGGQLTSTDQMRCNCIALNLKRKTILLHMQILIEHALIKEKRREKAPADACFTRLTAIDSSTPPGILYEM